MKQERTFKKIETVSKKSRLIELLKEAILSGRLASGESIVEGRMSQEFGVGQGVLREAPIELEHQGFVQRTPYSGTRVTTLTHDDARHIYDLRILLEPSAFVQAAPHIKGKPWLNSNESRNARKKPMRTRISSTSTNNNWRFANSSGHCYDCMFLI